MEKLAGWWKYLLSLVMLLSVCATGALAFDVTGNVTSTHAKRVYLSVRTPSGNFGTSIASAPGSFTIQGVPAGSNYIVSAFEDVLDTGSRHASDPSGVTSAPFNVSGNTSGINLALTTPTVASVPAPSGLIVMPSDNSALVMWNSINNGQGELADKYALFWSTSPDVVGTYTTQGGILTNIPASGDMRGLILTNSTFTSGTPIANGATLYFAVTAKIGNNESNPATLATPVTIGPGAGPYSVSGTVTFTGPTAGKPLLMAVVDSNQNGPPSQMHMTKVANPMSPQSYTVTGVPNGTYRVYAFIDVNGNNLVDAGDLNLSDAAAPPVTVANAPVANTDITLSSTLESAASVRTNHWKDDSSESYGLNFEIEGKYKRPVKVTLATGPNVTGPLDIALDDYGRFYSWVGIGASVPQVNDSYLLDVTYSDSSSGTVAASVTGVLSSNDNFATLVAPVGAASFNAAPTFSWTAPVSPPADFYGYSLSLNQYNGGIYWDPKEMSSATTSVTYDFDGSASQGALTDNTAYNWQVSVFDAAGNSATRQTSFTFGTTGDIQPPSVPDGVTAAGVNSNQINVAWNVATDNVGVNHYIVYRNGSIFDQLFGATSTSLSDATVTTGIPYNYTVVACDLAGNCSAPSTLVTATATGTPPPPDTIAPTIPAGATAITVSPIQINVTWSVSSDNVGVANYRIYRDGAFVNQVDGGASTSWQDSSLMPNTTYTYTVTACDAAANCSALSNAATATTDPGTTSPPPDTTAPSIPGSVSASAINSGQINVNWNISTDDVGVAYYVIYRNSSSIGQSGGPSVTTWQDNSVAPNSTYTYNVAACDNAGNCSAQSNSATATTPSGSVSTPVTISGTITYGGAKTGRIYVYARTNNGLTVGTSISSTGAYTIEGVPAGSYTLSAFMDPLGLGARVHNSPAGSVSVTATGTAATANIALTDQTTLVAGQPTSVEAAIGDASVLMSWNGGKDSNGLNTADTYKVYWHTNNTVSKTNNLGSKAVPAEIDSPVMIGGLTNGTAYYFVVVPSADGVDGIASTVYGPVTIGAPTGGHTVSGTVTYTGAFSAGGVMYIAVAKPDSKGVGTVYYTKIASPAAVNSFTVNGVPDGTYEVFALYDKNNDGLFAIGDIMPNDESAPLITVAGSAVSAGTISLVSANADVTITTQHGKQVGNSSEWYNVNGNFRGQLLRPVAVKLTSAPASSGIATPVDIGLEGREIRFWSNTTNPPVVGDVYTFTVYFADGSSQVFTPAVTGVLGSNSFPVNPTVTGSSTVPTFSWGAPTAPPANYKYSLWVGNNSINLWDAWALPSTQTSAVYGFDGGASALQANTQYGWNLSVRDQNGNEASVNGNFTPTVAVVSISGTVTSTGSTGISGALVSVYNAAGSQVASATADANGNYSVTGLATGSYRLLFSAANYISQYYNNKTTLALADTVAVVLGTPTTNVNCTLVLGGKITGTVTDAALTGISGVTVQSYNAVSGALMSGTTTDTSGNYTISGLAAGNYKIRFTPSTASGLVSLWYNGKVVNSVWTADQVTVAAEATTSGIDAVLTQGGSISGTVTDSSSVGIAGASVTVYDAATNSVITGVTTAADGTYTVSGLPTGECKVSFYAVSAGYVGQFYSNKITNFNVANVVSVTAGSTVTGINATLAMGGKISGTVTSSTGTVMSGIIVYAYDAATNMIASNASTTSGAYTISGLPAGNYKVRFNDTNSVNNHVAVWSSNKPSIAAADSVAVTVGATTGGVNASLVLGGTISGQVTDGVNGVANITVNAYNDLDESVASATTSATGTYTLRGLPSGSYKLRFQEMLSSTYVPVGYVPQVYTNPNINVTYLSQATPVAVVVGTPVTGIDAVLSKDVGSISGTVTDASSGLPVAGATARVTDLNGGTYGSAITDASGNYVVKGIPTGSYKVEFFMFGKYAQQWYSAKGDFATATTVSVTAPATTTAVNAALGTGPSIYLPAVIKGYGTVNVASTSTRTFQINNSGSSNLAIGTLSVAGADFTLLNDLCSGKTLAPISFCTIQVSFTPSSIGAKTATVTIPSNDPETPSIGFTVKGTGASNETVPPTIVSTTPANNATNVSITALLTVKFSEAVDQTTLPVGTAFLKTSTGTFIPGTGSYDAATNTGTFTPLAPLAYNTTYTGTFSGIKDLSGNVLATPYTFTFTTGANPDATAPTVAQITPVNNAQNVSVDSVLTVKFSEAVKPATVQSALILRAGSTVVPGTVTYDSATNTASFTPAAPLAMGTTYSLSVGNAIEDLAGNKLNSLTIFFTTQVPSGDIDGSGSVDISDAYKLLEIAVGNIAATPQDLKRADIAPLVNGKPKPDGVIDVADVVVMLRRIVGLVTW